MKKIISWICASIVAITIFVTVLTLIPLQIKVAEKMELSYIFVDSKWVEYDIFEPVHGAATDWSFLFKENEGMPAGGDENTGSLETVEIEDKIKEIENAEKSQVDLNNLIKDIEEIKKEQEIKKDNESDPIKDVDLEQCSTPWGTMLNHGESVIAYEQRKDVPNICNAQRRVCNNWILDGTYQQWACNEDIEYKYIKVKVISFNTEKPDELIQNPKYAKNDWAEFDTDGKINPTEKNPQTDRDNSIKDDSIIGTSSNISNKTYYNCTSPRWEVVQHGQFIKAYKSTLGFTDEPCQVELRLCLDGRLNGTYNSKMCEYKNISTQDYRWWNTDPNKVTQELLNETHKNEKWGFWGWFISRFK